MNTSDREAILREIKAVEVITDLATAEAREFTDDERTEITRRLDTAKSIKQRSADKDSLRKNIADLVGEVGFEPPVTEATEPDAYARRGKGKSLGQSFVESPEFKALIGSVPNGRFGEKSRVQSAPYGVKDLITGVDRTTDAGTLLVPQSLGLVDPFYQRPLTVRQLVTNGTTGTDTIEYVKLTSVTNNAAPVPEATTTASVTTGPPAVTIADAGVKPESAMVFEKVTTNVKTLAHWIPATKRALSDVGQVRTLIDAFLVYGLEEELEDQILTGTGVGENLLGLGATSGVQTQAAPAGAQTRLDTTRIARRKVRIGGRSNPTAYVLNPVDWEGIELLKDTTGRYLGAGPWAMSQPTLWGLPVVESEAVPAGTAYVGDWTKAVLWDREQASIQVTDSHADFFIRNLVAILAELRVAFGVLRPSAFVKITL